MRLLEWRKNKALVLWLTKLLESQEGKEFVEMLQTEHCLNYEAPAGPASEAAASFQLGKIRGYNGCINNILAAIVPLSTAEPIQSTFELPKE